MCTVGGRIGWIGTKSGTARRPGIADPTTDKRRCGTSGGIHLGMVPQYCSEAMVLEEESETRLLRGISASRFSRHSVHY